MKYSPLVHRLGAATITRIEEVAFDSPPRVLSPDWDEAPSLAARFSPASSDPVHQRIPLRPHVWVLEIGGMAMVIDTGTGNGKSRPFSERFDMLDNPVMDRFEDAGFQRESRLRPVYPSARGPYGLEHLFPGEPMGAGLPQCHLSDCLA